MPIPLMVVAPPNELEAILKELATRPDVALYPFPSGEHAWAALSQLRPQGVLLRSTIPDGSGIEFCAALRRRPETAETRIIVLCNEGETAVFDRDACLAAGADDVLFAPSDRSLLAARLLALDAGDFRRIPRIPFSADLKLSLSGGPPLTARSDGLSALSLKIHWTGPAPARGLASVELDLPVAGRRRLWARLEEVASRGGKVHGLVLRWIGLTAAERGELQIAAGVRSKTGGLPVLESPAHPAKFGESKPVPTSEYKLALPEAPGAPAPAASGRAGSLLAGGLVACALALGAGAFFTVRSFLHPSLAVVRDPKVVAGDLQLREFYRDRDRMVGICDATWTRLSVGGKRHALEVLLERARSQKSAPRSLEIYDPMGLVARVSLATSAGHLSISTLEIVR